MRAGDFFKAAGLCLALGACAPGPSIAYLEPAPKPAAATRQLNRPLKETWNTLVGNLSNEAFRVKIVDKAARTIDVSFSSDDPGAYIDCGQFLTDDASPSGAPERSRIGLTDNAQLALYLDYGASTSLSWKTGLRGRAMIYVVSFGERTTSVLVDIEYAFIVTATYQRLNVFDSPIGEPVTETTVTRLATNKPARGRSRSQTVTCFSKGVLERSLLDAAT